MESLKSQDNGHVCSNMTSLEISCLQDTPNDVIYQYHQLAQVWSHHTGTSLEQKRHFQGKGDLSQWERETLIQYTWRTNSVEGVKYREC